MLFWYLSHFFYQQGLRLAYRIMQTAQKDREKEDFAHAALTARHKFWKMMMIQRKNWTCNSLSHLNREVMK